MLDNSVIRLEVRSGAVSVIPAQKYQVYDSVTVIDGSGSLGEQPYVAVRQGNDLVLLYADGTEVVLQDYFLGDTLFSMDGLGGVIELPADMAPIGTVDGKALYAFGGSPDAAGSILAKSSSFSPLEPLLTDDSLGAALIGDGGNIGVALAGLGAGGLGLAAMVGGAGAGAFLGSVANAITVISGTFVAGPVIAGNGLVVDLYDNTGALLQAGIPLNEDGSFSITLQGTFPNVIAIMRDLNENPDYRDEATGADTDLNATLMGLGAGDPQPNGTTNVALNINPVTTVAARLAGVGAEGEIPAGGVSPEKITESIQQVQETFGLSDINGVVPKDIFDEDFDDTDGDIDDGEQYGQVLAMLSGKDKLNQGDQGATIEEFVSAIDDAGDDTAAAQSAVRSELLAGAREFEFNNEDGTETEADLLRAPSLGIERTPQVNPDGTTAEQEFSALLEDAVNGTSTGAGANPNAETVEQFQTLVDTANAVQDVVELEAGAEIPQAVRDQLNEENLTALGLTGLVAPSPYIDALLAALSDPDAAPEGFDTVAELQAILDSQIAEILTPTTVVTPNDDGTISVSGTSAPGATVEVTFPDGTTGTAITDENGNYGPITSATAQTSGAVVAGAEDPAGNTSDPVSEAYEDETAPLAPSQTVTTNDDGTLSVSGTGEPGSTVTTVFPDGTTGTALVAEDGNYGPITSETPQTTGTVSSTQTDEAGNTSPVTTEAYTDTTAPTAPTIDTPTPNEDGTLSVSGTGEPGSTATVRFPDGTIGAAVVGPDGTFGPITSSAPQTSGDVTATQTDGAGNVSPTATVPFSDEVGPQPPVLGAIEQTLDGTLSVSGTGEPGAIATVTFPDGSTGTTTVRPDGSFGPVTSDAPQTDGTVSAIQTDEAGNPSEADTAEFDDGQAPLAPGNLVATSNEDGTIDVSGTGEPGSTATVTFPDGTSATALVEADGTFGPVTSAAPQTTGTVSATQTDEAGNTSAPAATEAYFDETPPLPVNLIVTPNDDGTIDVSGTGEPGATATVIFPDGTSATTTIGDDGAFGPVTSEAPQTTGTVSATQTDEANNVSEPSTEDYVDTNEPLNPTIDPVTPNDDGTLSISGTGEPGATMTVFFPDGTTATALVEADGSYGPVTSEAPQTSGDVIVNQADEAGNQSEDVVSAYTDETAPLEPFLDPARQNQDGTLSVSGTGEPGSTVQVTFPDGTVGSALVDDSGDFGPVISAAPQTSGEVSATQTDEAGNTSDRATEAYSDTTAPEAPSQVVTPNDDGTLSVSGTGEPGSTVTTEFPDGTSGTALVAEDGSYGPITSAAPQTTGTVSSTQTDEAGNTSVPQSETVTDETAPLAPEQTVTTNDDGTLSVSGTGEPGSTVTTTFPDGTTGTAVVNDDGSYGPITSETPQTTGEVSSTQTDEAGNTSPVTTEAYTDTTAPTAPTIDTPTPNEDGTLSVSGTGEPGSTATVRFPDGTIGAAVVGPDGTFGPITSSAPQTSGDVTATQTDGAGNVSPTATVPFSDEVGPQPPVLGAIEQTLDGTLSVSGTGEPGAIATVTFPDGSTGTTTVRPDGSFGPVTSDAPQTSGAVSAVQTDEAGNPSEADTAEFDDGQAPLSPGNLVATSNEDGTIDVSGTGEPGSTATVTFPDGTSATALVEADGTFGPVTSAAPQTTGTVSATQTDEAGNTSAPAATEAYFDETPPLPVNLIVTPNDDGTIDVSGTGEPGATATVIFPDGTSATTTIGDDGAFGPVTSEAPQTTGTVSATQTDEANNVSEPSTEDYVDTNEPLNPTIDPVTPNDDGTLSISGTGEPGATMTVFFPDGTTATALVEADGSYGPVTSEAPQTSGDVIVNQADEAGNQSEDVVSAYTDETAPLEPFLDPARQNQDGTLSVSGTGEPGSTVQVTFPDGTVGNALVDDSGDFGPVISAAPQTSGEVSATQTDEAGNTSARATEDYSDTTAPEAPSQVVTPNDDGTLSVSGTGEPGSTVTTEFPDGSTATATVLSDGSYGPITSAAPQTTGEVSSTQTDEAGNTSDPQSETVTDETAPLAPSHDVTTNDDGTLSVSGTGEPGSTVTTTFPDGTTGTALVAEDGSYGPITSEAPQTTGDVSSTQTDAAGNTSVPQSETVTDGTAPLAPSQDVTPNDDGTLSVSGTGEPGSTVTTVFPDGTSGTALVAEDGSYGPITSAAPQTTGEVSSTQTDAAGNTSEPQSETVTDETAPLAPEQTVTTNDDGTLSVSGTGEPGSTVTTVFPDGTSGTALVAEDGSYGPITSETPQTTGEVSSTQTDEAGNTSVPQSETVTDETAPLAPSQTVTPNDDGTLSVSGTGEPGSTVTTTFPDGTTGTALVADDGSYGPITSAAPQTTGEVSSTQTDAAGNTSEPQSETVTDETAPLAPTASSVMDSSTGAITTTGTAEPGSIVTVTFPDGTSETATAAPDGSYSVTSGPDQPSGNVMTTATDEAGNISDPDTDPIVENVPPAAPTINPGITDQANTVSGTGEPGATVTVLDAGSNVIGTASVWTDGTWSFVADPAVADGAVLTATQEDAAGNVSLSSGNVTTFTDTDGDGTSNLNSADDDGDGISDAVEAATESESVISYPAQTVPLNMSIGSPTPGYTSGTTTDNSSGSLIDITAVAPGESGTGTTTTALGTGTISRFNYKANVVGGETVEDLTIGIAIGSFDDGLYVEIDGTVIVDFTGRDYQSLPSMLDYNSDGNADDFGFAWAPFRGEGDPELVVDLANSTVQLLVTETDGITRSDIFAAMLADGFDATPNDVPEVDATSPEGVTIGTGFRNANINSGDGGNISEQTITVTGRFAGADDVDGDVVAGTSVLIENWVDIDSDNDRVWDKYDGTADSDGDGVSDYRDPDSDNDGTLDGVQASLNQAQVNALVAGGTYADQFIVLSDAVTMDFTAIGNTAFSNVEYIDMNEGANAQTVTIDADSLTAMTDADNELIIVGDSNDTVNAIGFVDTGKDQSIQGQRFNIYESNDATLIIRDGMTVSLTEEGAISRPGTPSLDAGITDQANTVSGTGDPGATVTVSEGDIVIGSAVAWTDGTWSFVADSPIADGAELTVTQSLDGFTSAASTVTTFTDTDGDGTANSVVDDADGDLVTDTVEDEAFRNTTGTGTNDLRFVQWGTDFDNGVQVGDIQTLVLPDGSVVTFEVTGVTSSVANGTDDNIAGAPSTFSGAFLNTRYTLPDGSINGPVNGTDTFTFAISAVDVLGNTISPTIFWVDSEATANGTETNGATTNGGNWTVVEQAGSPGVNGVGTQTVTVTNTNFDGGTGGAIYSSTNTTEVTVTIQGNGGVQGFSLGVVGNPNFDYQDLDQDGIDNSLDIDTDGDRIWDKYETGSDANGVPNYRDTDSDNNGTADGVEESVTAAEITALTSGTDTYDEGYILLSEPVTLDFTQINDARFTADVEYIDMNDGIRQVVTLNESEVIALTDADNELIIVGDASDVVNATGFEDTGKDQSIQGQSFSIYEANGAALFIDDEITNIVTT